MPQDVTFDLPFETPVGEHLQFARARHLRRLRDMDLVYGKAGFEECTSWDLSQAADRTCPRASAEDIGVLVTWSAPAFLERPRASDPVVAPRLTGRERFLIDTAEAAMQVLVL
ncbi:hypothetical protein [Streptomyces sp. NPDC058457]|uniref:hypothetical protein n=1 Tax=Streptomyces sp. NPDC058457 TaxID=3346507 RepID=UPI0036649E80